MFMTEAFTLVRRRHAAGAVLGVLLRAPQPRAHPAPLALQLFLMREEVRSW
jgi:hypothetical protein